MYNTSLQDLNDIKPETFDNNWIICGRMNDSLQLLEIYYNNL